MISQHPYACLRGLCFFICFFMSQALFAQDNPPSTFGKISVSDFENQVYAIDSSANAVILADVGQAEFIANSRAWFSIRYKHYRRIHILNKNGYDHANVLIGLYMEGANQEKLVSAKGNTYTLSDGKIETTKLTNDQIFTEKQSANRVVNRFTLPNVKEGCIIEYEYTTTSDFLFRLPSWAFQGSIPRLWSEYTVSIPEFLEYVFLAQGYHPLHKHDTKTNPAIYTVANQTGVSSKQNAVSIRTKVITNRWIMKDVPVLKEEPFTSTLANHISNIEFQLSAYAPPLARQKIMSSWPETCKKLLEYETFGADLGKENRWLAEYIGSIIDTVPGQLDRAKRIYAYMRDNYTCTQRRGLYLSKAGLRNVASAKGGRTSDINLLLTAMLRYAGLDAAPVILSTRDNGYPHIMYPLMHKYNYVVVAVKIEGENHLLDASQQQLPFGTLSPDCYSGVGRKIDAVGEPIALFPDSLIERKVASVRVFTDDQGRLSNEIDQWPGKFESMHIRTKLKADGLEGFRKETAGKLGSSYTLDHAEANGYRTPDSSVHIKYVYHSNNTTEQVIYIQPLQHEIAKENPFKSADRKYPVEMPFGFDNTITFSLYIPDGYQMEEIPKQLVISLDDARSCIFQYRVNQQNNMIQISSRIICKRATFMPEEYEALRAFFDHIVKKQNEHIVLKKI